MSNAQGDQIRFGSLARGTEGDPYFNCSYGDPAKSFWGGKAFVYCPFVSLWDSASNSNSATSTNSAQDTAWDACGTMIFSGGNSGYHDDGDASRLTMGDGIDGDTSLLGSRGYRYPRSGVCFGDWVTEFSFTVRFTDGQTLTATVTQTFPVYASASAMVAQTVIQPAPEGGAIGDKEQLAGCGQSRSTRTQATRFPVDPATGNFWHTFTDLTIPGRGPAISARRTYNSVLAQNDGPFGYGWSDAYGERLNIGADSVTFQGCNGSETTFDKEADGSYTAPPRVVGTLTRDAQGGFAYAVAGGNTKTFDDQGRLTSITDPFDQATTVTYPSSNTRVVTDPAGRTVTFTFTNGRISELRDGATPARVVTYDYDPSGNLTDVTDVGGGHWQFGYDQGHHLLTMRSPRFHQSTQSPPPVVTTHYDTQGRVDWQSDQLGRKTTFAYQTSPTATVVTDPAGNATRYEYQDGLMVFETRGYNSPNSNDWLYRYDPATLGRTLVVDGNGYQSSATYEADGDLSTAVDANNVQTSYTYNARHQVRTVTRNMSAVSRDVVTTFDYDASGRLRTTSQPLISTGGNVTDTAVTTLEYGDSAHPTDITGVVDPGGHRTTRRYDNAGNLIAVIQPPTAQNPDGDETTFSYAQYTGWLMSATTARGNLPGAAPGSYTTTWTHNAYGDITAVRNPLWSATTPVANQVVFTYDDDGNLATSTDGMGRITTLTYDAAAQLTKAERGTTRLQLNDYYPNGRLKSTTDALDGETKFTYDSLGNVLTRTDPLNRVTTLATDPLGHVTAVTDPSGQTTTYRYNALGQVKAITFPSGGPVSYSNIAYDEFGRRTAATSTAGTASWVYDSLGRLTGSTSATGTTVGYGYDLEGRQTSITYPNSAGAVVRHYDESDRLTALEAFGEAPTQFTYEADGALKGIQYPNGTATSYQHDQAGRVQSISATRGGTVQTSFGYTYDGNGQVATATSTGVPSDNHTYTYDDQARLKTVDNQTAQYDGNGNLTTRLDGVKQAYDPASQLSGNPAAPITPVGSSSTSNSNATTLTLTLPAVQAGDLAVLYVSYPAGKTLTGPAGATERGTYLSGGSKPGNLGVYTKTLTSTDTSITVSFQGKFDKSAAVTVYRNVNPVNPVGTVTGAFNAAGTSTTVQSFATQPGNRLVWGAGAYGTAGTWTPPSGTTARTSKTGSSTDVAVADQETTGSPTGAMAATHTTSAALTTGVLLLQQAETTYTHDTRGNRTSRLDPAGTSTNWTFDNANQLTTAAGAAYTYDVDGLRTTKTVSGTTTNYAWDVTAPNAELLADKDANYVYGPNGLPLQRVTASGRSYYQHDLLGSTRALTDATGTVQATLTYDPYGSTTSATGSSTNPLKYAGQYQDTDTGLYYMRARYYDPTTASFLSRDPLEATTAQPYGYAANDPINLTDPSGQCPVCPAVAGALWGGFGNYFSQVMRNPQAECDPIGELNWKELGKAALEGAGLAAGVQGAVAAVGARGVATSSSSAVLEFGSRAAARQGISGDASAAVNRFFRGSTAKSQDFRVTEMASGGYRLQFFSPARNPGYGKLYVQEIDSQGNIVVEYKNTVGPNGFIETKWVHGEG
ncbi:RHS repeat-associated core domain-containing protein [Phycicoccus sp. Soil803]|uniref:RHS repeat-associated core domain-containing protein n=1 Tax=Phycicoccus sp. Soil803 TaxID=1736415 RepID=UPI00138F6003|nr:RHS repeat-associated core domain-containing protein [Phycicoccus sp. Soil803]